MTLVVGLGHATLAGGPRVGTTGMTVILQLTSFLLVCIGVQIVWNGAKALLAPLPAVAH